MERHGAAHATMHNTTCATKVRCRRPNLHQSSLSNYRAQARCQVTVHMPPTQLPTLLGACNGLATQASRPPPAGRRSGCANHASNRADFKRQASSFDPPVIMRGSEIQGNRVLTWLILDLGHGACQRSGTCRLRAPRPPFALSRRVASPTCASRRDPTRFRQLAIVL